MKLLIAAVEPTMAWRSYRRKSRIRAWRSASCCSWFAPADRPASPADLCRRSWNATDPWGSRDRPDSLWPAWTAWRSWTPALRVQFSFYGRVSPAGRLNFLTDAHVGQGRHLWAQLDGILHPFGRRQRLVSQDEELALGVDDVIGRTVRHGPPVAAAHRIHLLGEAPDAIRNADALAAGGGRVTAVNLGPAGLHQKAHGHQNNRSSHLASKRFKPDWTMQIFPSF